MTADRSDTFQHDTLGWTDEQRADRTRALETGYRAQRETLFAVARRDPAWARLWLAPEFCS